jgi:hypothetical protein
VPTVLVTAPGCISYLHPIEKPKPEYVEACQSVPYCSREHVYVFFVHGMDPCNYANLSGLRDYVQALGFPKTYYGQLYHKWSFDKEIRKVREHDPEARFVLVGYSFGANMVRDIAQAAAKDGIGIDLLFYIGGNTLRNKPEDQPENAIRIVHILSQGWDWMGEPLDRAENINIAKVYHFGSPTDPQTCRALARNLAEVAAAIPVPDKPEAPIRPLEEQAPTPRKLIQHTAQKPSEPLTSAEEWNFLQPVSRLKMPPALKDSSDKKHSEPEGEANDTK